MIVNIDCLVGMSAWTENSFDAIVTDPPYELGFMGKSWDAKGIAYNVELWRQALRVLKPGGYMVAFGGSRTYHRMACAIEDAGFEMRDCIMWLYGSGFPKSHNGEWGGTALKPAHEPIVLARKPPIGTVADNVAAFGVGGLNIDGCRVGTESTARLKTGGRNDFPNEDDNWTPKAIMAGSENGRWPANVIHDGSDEVTAGFPSTAPSKAANRGNMNSGRHGGESDIGSNRADGTASVRGHSDAGGSASRFFYCAKASRADRDEGLSGFPSVVADTQHKRPRSELDDPRRAGVTARINHHPTVKPTDLMRYLCRLITPSGGTILDPFAGSGSTGKAAVLEGFKFIGFELEPDYAAIAQARINAVRSV